MKKSEKVVVRPFTAKDLLDVIEMDNNSGNDVRQTVEELDSKLEKFYNKIGFEMIPENDCGCMVLTDVKL